MSFVEWLDRHTPARQLTNVAELNALPAGAIIHAAFPAGAMEKHPNGRDWWGAGTHITYPASRVPLPAQLLWLPEEPTHG